ncbi:hypothetical protein GQ55_3G040300 [Panicum hallii var. hallii]|uniref:SAP domain-containing protein n=1 Tax=Panicum hallii var. hallii TaxID=1504633 RepID=A0A2T7E5J2_9POAL|nr:hypothetical protein GQ55_3G040300 [Panicum hallii var. hallii]
MSIKASNQPLRRSRRRLFPQRSPSRPLLPYQNPSILAAIQERPGPRLSGGWMEFTAMKRRELLDICRQHGLATRGSKADLAASLAGAISGAAAAESVVEVVVGKGCLKRLGGSASGGTSGAAKEVRFALDEESEERARRRRSQVILQPVVTKTRGRHKARKIHPAAAVSGRGCRWKRDDVGGDSADKDVIGEVGADAPLTWSTMPAVCLCAHSEAESQNNPAEAEKEGEVFEAAIDRKWKQKPHENAEVIAANAQAAGNKWRKTRGKPKAEEAFPDTVVSGRGSRQKCDVGGGYVHHCAFGEVSADAPVTQSRTEAMDLCPESGVECQNNPVEAEEEGLVVGTAIDCRKQKRKRKAQENAKGIAANAQGGVSHGSTRKSSLSTAAVLLSAVVENKRRRKLGNDKDESGDEEQTAQVQDLATVVSPVDIENERSRRNSEDCVPAVQKSGRTTRSHSVQLLRYCP